MLRLRPAHPDDLPALVELAARAGAGMTNLPANPEVLGARIQRSRDSLQRQVETPTDEVYFFVLEDMAAGRLAGTCGIIARVGMTRPFYSFKIVTLIHVSRELNRYDPVKTLQMVNEYQGATEIAMLLLHPDYRRDGNGRFLSRSRYLFLAAFPERFDNLVMAEMRGVSDAEGHSAFWEGLGRHFFDMDFTRADFLVASGHYHFINDLMPKHPIYIRLLPEAAQAVIGVAHPDTRPALALLEREGFRFEGCVDVFDAGPTVHCPRDQIHSVRTSRQARVSAVVADLDLRPHLIANTRLEDFSCCRGGLWVDPHNEVRITPAVAKALTVEPGDTVRYVLF